MKPKHMFRNSTSLDCFALLIDALETDIKACKEVADNVSSYVLDQIMEEAKAGNLDGVKALVDSVPGIQAQAKHDAAVLENISARLWELMDLTRDLVCTASIAQAVLDIPVPQASDVIEPVKVPVVVEQELDAVPTGSNVWFVEETEQALDASTGFDHTDLEPVIAANPGVEPAPEHTKRPYSRLPKDDRDRLDDAILCVLSTLPGRKGTRSAIIRQAEKLKAREALPFAISTKQWPCRQRLIKQHYIAAQKESWVLLKAGSERVQEVGPNFLWFYGPAPLD